MKAKFAILKREIGEGRAYALASQAVGRALVPGFGLSTCTRSELIRILDALTGRQAVPPGRERQQAAGRRRTPLPRRADGELRASLPQLSLLRTMVEELRWGPDECAGHFTRACGTGHPITARAVQKCIEMCKAVKARRQRAHRRGPSTVLRTGAEGAEAQSVG